jgi:hypothetical protein
MESWIQLIYATNPNPNSNTNTNPMKSPTSTKNKSPLTSNDVTPNKIDPEEAGSPPVFTVHYSELLYLAWVIPKRSELSRLRILLLACGLKMHYREPFHIDDTPFQVRVRG